MKRISSFLAAAALIIVSGVSFFEVSAGHCNPGIIKPELFSYVLVGTFPHDPEAFTQGLAWDNGNVYEGTGLYGQSSLRRVDLQTGKVELRRDYDSHIFAEGITIFNDVIYQLTWKNNIIFKYDKKDFSLIDSWSFPHQGWGVTHDNEHLIVSDGTARLYFLDPTTLLEERRISVHDNHGPVSRLNELEYVNTKIYANIWQTDRIAVISPADGVVTGYLDLSGLSARMKHGPGTGVLNGIMYDPDADRLFVTGKRWPSLFEIKLIAQPQ